MKDYHDYDRDHKDFDELSAIVRHNDYDHYLDYYGRTICVEGDLRLEKAKRNTYAQRIEGGEYRRENDDGFHIIAASFGGWGGSENLVASERLLNREYYRSFEREWTKHLEAGRDVHVKVTPLYLENDTRPYALVGEYTVSGKDIEPYTDYISFTNEDLEKPEFDLSDYDDFDPYPEEHRDVEEGHIDINADVQDIKDESDDK